jgi:hypothetical protein
MFTKWPGGTQHTHTALCQAQQQRCWRRQAHSHPHSPVSSAATEMLAASGTFIHTHTALCQAQHQRRLDLATQISLKFLLATKIKLLVANIYISNVGLASKKLQVKSPWLLKFFLEKSSPERCWRRQAHSYTHSPVSSTASEMLAASGTFTLSVNSA